MSLFHRLQGVGYTGSVGLDHSCVNSGRDSTARSPTPHCGQVHTHGHRKPSDNNQSVVWLMRNC